MKPLFLALPGNEKAAGRLAMAVGGDVCASELRTFPDGESYIRIKDDPAGRMAVLVCSLAHPNAKFLPLVFAADTLRELGAHKVGLVAPYLAYMRQDCRFHPGEAVTSKSFAGLISRSFDWLLTIDPHLHRYTSLDQIYSIPCHVLHAGPVVAGWIERHVERPFLIGPDGESRQWVAAVAAGCGAGYGVLQKNRLGDRAVAIDASGLRIPPDVTPVLLDDIVSSGTTVLQAMAEIRRQTSVPAVAIAIHGLADPDLDTRLAKTGTRLVTTNSIAGTHAEIDIVPLLASGLSELALT